MELFIYLLKVSGCTAAFFVVYYVWLQKLTFFNLNRWYLLSSLVFSLAVPLFCIGIKTAAPSVATPVFVHAVANAIVDVPDPLTIGQPVSHIDWLQFAVYLYILIAGGLLVKLLLNFASVMSS